jgi:DNA helicase HerA-like ATPase
MPVLLVCEEAHRYAPEKDEEFFGPTKSVLSRIAKEGRKYGVSLGLVSQRPSELSVSILSQCNTIFALRMGNEHDLDFVQAVLPESAAGLLKVLPGLHLQEAIVAGTGVTAPMRVKFSDLAPEERPQTHTVPFSQAWQEDTFQREYIDTIVARWRNQKQ